MCQNGKPKSVTRPCAECSRHYWQKNLTESQTHALADIERGSGAERICKTAYRRNRKWPTHCKHADWNIPIGAQRRVCWAVTCAAWANVYEVNRWAWRYGLTEPTLCSIYGSSSCLSQSCIRLWQTISCFLCNCAVWTSEFYDRHTSRHQRQKAENCRFTVKKVMIRISPGPSLYVFEPHLLLRTTA